METRPLLDGPRPPRWRRAAGLAVAATLAGAAMFGLFARDARLRGTTAAATLSEEYSHERLMLYKRTYASVDARADAAFLHANLGLTVKTNITYESHSGPTEGKLCAHRMLVSALYDFEVPAAPRRRVVSRRRARVHARARLRARSRPRRRASFARAPRPRSSTTLRAT